MQTGNTDSREVLRFFSYLDQFVHSKESAKSIQQAQLLLIANNLTAEEFDFARYQQAAAAIIQLNHKNLLTQETLKTVINLAEQEKQAEQILKYIATQNAIRTTQN